MVLRLVQRGGDLLGVRFRMEIEEAMRMEGRQVMRLSVSRIHDVRCWTRAINIWSPLAHVLAHFACWGRLTLVMSEPHVEVQIRACPPALSTSRT